MDAINLSGIDLSILISFIIFIVWWALRNRKTEDSTAYFLAGRNMSWIMVGLSLFAASIYTIRYCE
jgi:SSS family solute:Na+ symporter